ncbi:glycosyl transferase, group 1 [Indibacter alkaliphilus LW1]|uniref:Glycosyl transferase, group 1 n=1 Tax=Indibacter alkaliphilus (strain CCUG 57479 / KCTC 22604 / LW1) TaxID=1189612 RepID=S2D4A2_INDAL|nr:glycosyltransferase [Indibacter alkaliphilus]EOZ93759.1 glycosyl transferase, group 1 [Indibacter alkaliphilus LW1]
MKFDNLIVFKLSEFPAYSETFIVRNVIGAIEKGYQVRILANLKNHISNSSQKDLLEKYKLLEKVYTVKSIPITPFRRIRNLIWDIIKKPYLVFLFLKFTFLKRNLSYYFLYLIKEYHFLFKAKVVHVHFCDQFKPLQNLFHFGLLEGKIVITFHGYDVELLATKNKSDIPVLNQIGSVFISNSEFTKSKLIQLGLDSNKIQVVYNGIDVSISEPTQRDSVNHPLRLLSVGRLVAFKGHIYALKSVLELVQNGCKVKYTIIGEGKEFENLIAFVKSNGLEEHVQFLGKKTQSEIFEQFIANDIFLFPSTVDNNGRMENFGVASLEAQLFGLPVIGFDVGGFPETLKNEKTGFIVPDKDYKRMAKKIIELVENNYLYSMTSKEAQNHIRKYFNYTDIFKKLDRVYTS